MNHWTRIPDRQSACNKLTIAQKSYLAGLIDGDGSLKKYNKYWKLVIVQRDIRSLAFVKKWIGHGSLKPYTIKGRKEKYHYYGLYHGATLLDLLQQVSPYLIWKKNVAKKAIGDIKRNRKEKNW